MAQHVALSRNRKIRTLQKRNIALLILGIIMLPVTITAIRYCFHSFRTYYSELMSYSVGWNPLIDWIDKYKVYFKAKQDFIEGSAIAQFFSSLNGSLLKKILQIVLVLASALFPIIDYYAIKRNSQKIDKIREALRELRRRRRNYQ